MLQRTGATVVSFRQSAGIALSRALILTKMTALLDYWLAVGIPGAGLVRLFFSLVMNGVFVCELGLVLC